MNPTRYLCSHLVLLRVHDGSEQWVNLEEIWSGGAVVACEQEVVADALLTFSADNATFDGRAASVEQDEFGWSVEIEFAEGSAWTLDKFRPDFALNPEEVK